MYDFIQDLDAYFCEKFSNYDALCILPGYQMPTMQATKIDDFGRTVAYTLPSENLRLALQENKVSLLASLKEKMIDKTFSFSFRPFRFFELISVFFAKYSFHKHLKFLLTKHGANATEAGASLNIDKDIWDKIVKGVFEPSKNLILSLCLTQHFSVEECKNLLYLCGFELDFSIVKDVVIAYLLENKVYNIDMIKAALAEYKVSNMFLCE